MKNVRNAMVTSLLVAMTALAFEVVADEKKEAGKTVNLNTATAEQLAYLPGIGPSKAEAIVKYREKRPFKKAEQLMRVKGISRKTFKKIRAHLVIEGPSTAESKIKVTN